MAAKKKRTFNQPLIEGMHDYKPIMPDAPQRITLQSHLGNRSLKLMRCMLGFKWDSGNKLFHAIPECGHFRPHGIIIWDPPKGAWLKQCLVGNNHNVLCSWDAIPAELFASSKSFEQIASNLEDGIEPPTWPDFDSAWIGNTIRIILTDNDHNAIGEGSRVAMWGLRTDS